MSEEAEALTCCCASCGIAEIDDVKLTECDDCDLVRYCSDECREDHKSEHDEQCKTRAAELRDELLFKQPESSHLGDCPICSLPLPLDQEKYAMYLCCCKLICRGCVIFNQIREEEARIDQKCPFCRKTLPRTKREGDKLVMKRIQANDPLAMSQEGGNQYDKGDYIRAFEYSTKAAELGVADAHFRLAHLYSDGLGVEMDRGKYFHHLEEAAIGGHPQARHNLGGEEWNAGNYERAVKHWIIAATMGDDDAIKMLLNAFKAGYFVKDELAAALRAHKAAVDATKSKQRGKAEEYVRMREIIESQANNGMQELGKFR